MWVFGYGSLMIGRWETGYGCTLRAVAELHGYRRVFNKASIANWGTRRHPCPTLNLEPCEPALCMGIAFEFPEAQAAAVEAYLEQREGKSFALTLLDVVVKERGSVHALVPLYAGKNILSSVTTEGLVAAVRQASGTRGACSNYVIDVHDTLIKLGIEDTSVTQLAELLRTTPQCH